MVRGVGIDLCAIDEMAGRMDDLASSFIATHFTPNEMRDVRSRPSGKPGQHAAARYAAKEACLKALSQVSAGNKLVPKVDYREIEVISTVEKPPYLMLHGHMREIARKLGIERVFLSLSHEQNMAAAVVVIE